MRMRNNHAHKHRHTVTPLGLASLLLTPDVTRVERTRSQSYRTALHYAFLGLLGRSLQPTSPAEHAPESASPSWCGRVATRLVASRLFPHVPCGLWAARRGPGAGPGAGPRCRCGGGYTVTRPRRRGAKNSEEEIFRPVFSFSYETQMHTARVPHRTLCKHAGIGCPRRAIPSRSLSLTQTHSRWGDTHISVILCTPQARSLTLHTGQLSWNGADAVTAWTSRISRSTLCAQAPRRVHPSSYWSSEAPQGYLYAQAVGRRNWRVCHWYVGKLPFDGCCGGASVNHSPPPRLYSPPTGQPPRIGATWFWGGGDQARPPCTSSASPAAQPPLDHFWGERCGEGVVVIVGLPIEEGESLGMNFAPPVGLYELGSLALKAVGCGSYREIRLDPTLGTNSMEQE